MYQLVISEKPSVAKALADVLGAKNRKNGYWEGNGYMVSWCIGHLVELAPPETYDADYAKWKKEDLPIVPHTWTYLVSEETKTQYAVLKLLLHDPKVDTVVCATDAGREGELIFRLVYNLAGCKKPVKRLWISSLEESAIRQGFASLRDGREYDHLYQAALCRAQADWLVGINSTRLYSLLHGQTLNIGRVMTPTLAMVVKRDNEIGAFRSEPFYTVELDCGFKAQSERFRSRAEADQLKRSCHCQTAIVMSIDDQEKTEKPPKLYDLTALQRDANRIFGFTAQQTLDYAQSLYEKKLMTYPRTDSRFLTSTMKAAIPALTHRVTDILPCTTSLQLPVLCDQVISDAKVTDHHALLPTQTLKADAFAELPAGEKDILSLVIVRLLCAVGEDHRYVQRTVVLDCQGQRFTAKGKMVTQMGWKIPEETYRGSLGARMAQVQREASIPMLELGQRLAPVMSAVKDGKTTPPKHYTEDTLLAAMETAGAADAPEDAERKGLGTPATRAGTLEKLISAGFVERRGDKKAQHLMATGKGHALISVVPQQIQSPLMTAQWEHRLKEIERGEADADAFISDIVAMLHELVMDSQQGKPSAFVSDQSVIGVCPRCGAAVKESGKGFFCESKDCRFAIFKNNQFFVQKGKPPNAKMVADLLKEGFVRLTGLRSAKNGKLYNATVYLDDSGSGYPRFRMEFEKKGGKR